MTTFQEWLDTATPERTHSWSKSDARVAFEAGRRAGLEEAAAECERMAAEILTAREEQYRYEQEKGYSNGPLRAGYTSEIQALTERATYISALASAPHVQEEAEHG